MSYDLAFSDDGGERRLWIPGEVASSMEWHCRAAFPNETGGILIGKYFEGRYAAVTFATAQPPDSIATSHTFERGILGLNETLAWRWTLGERYIGEWHFHPRVKPEASLPDADQMRRFQLASSLYCNEPLLLVAGGTPPTTFDVAAYYCAPKGRLISLPPMVKRGRP